MFYATARQSFFKETAVTRSLVGLARAHTLVRPHLGRFFTHPAFDVSAQAFDPKYCFADLQYLPDRNKYEEAVFEGVSQEEQAVFHRKTCVLTVSLSVNHFAQTSHQFAATAALVNKKFKDCKIVLGDALQRLTARIFVENSHLSDEELLKQALELGMKWQAENAETLSRFSIPVSIYRWLTFTQSPYLQRSVYIIRQHIEHNPMFRETFEHCAEAFLARLSARGDEIIAHDKAKMHCINYLIEECAALCQWHKLGADKGVVEVSAYGRNAAMDMMNQMILEPAGLSFPCYQLHFKRVATKEGLDAEPQFLPRHSVKMS